ncbi:MAG: hypothetical protein YK1309IOTA_480005 [Marine Group I thaumarchaeote]|nr:MAG: hypothetical protein YK1309IOTA_480005 [Marine Group I thaumarchaeote]
MELFTSGEVFELISILYQGIGFTLLLTHFSEILRKKIFTVSTRHSKLLRWVEKNAVPFGIVLVITGFCFQVFGIFLDKIYP